MIHIRFTNGNHILIWSWRIVKELVYWEFFLFGEATDFFDPTGGPEVISGVKSKRDLPLSKQPRIGENQVEFITLYWIYSVR